MVLGSLLVAAAAALQAQPAAPAGGIYTCVDAQGRRLTSDRPIRECLDREQRELNASGTTRRTLLPPPTASELAAKAERDRRDAEALARQQEKERGERVLLMRYPQQSAHDAERAAALQRVDESAALVRLRIAQLDQQHLEVKAAMARFDNDRARMPPGLLREQLDIVQALRTQQNAVADMEQDRRRIQQRFDNELLRLRPLWAQLPDASASASR
ncbi:DUF4124 domain-containing protein [Xylophilus sp. GW821-FHT01B05]